MIGHGPPARNVGEFCRLKCDDRDYECKVVEVGKDNHVVETIGFGLRITYPAKDLLPSLGKAARDEQEALARNFVENQVLWKVGDQCKVLRDGMKADAKIVELASDENGRAYAVVCFLDNSVEDSAWLDDLKVKAKAKMQFIFKILSILSSPCPSLGRLEIFAEPSGPRIKSFMRYDYKLPAELYL